MLLNKGASVNAVDKKGRTPLSIVATDCYQGYCDKPMLVRTIIVYAVLHSGITTKPECIVENSELSELWDYYQSEITCHLTNKELKDIIEAFPSQNLDNPSAEQLQAAAQAHN